MINQSPARCSDSRNCPHRDSVSADAGLINTQSTLRVFNDWIAAVSADSRNVNCESSSISNWSTMIIEPSTKRIRFARDVVMASEKRIKLTCSIATSTGSADGSSSKASEIADSFNALITACFSKPSIVTVAVCGMANETETAVAFATAMATIWQKMIIHLARIIDSSLIVGPMVQARVPTDESTPRSLRDSEAACP